MYYYLRNTKKVTLGSNTHHYQNNGFCPVFDASGQQLPSAKRTRSRRRDAGELRARAALNFCARMALFARFLRRIRAFSPPPQPQNRSPRCCRTPPHNPGRATNQAERARRGARGSVRVFGVTAEDIARAGMEVPASARALGHADHREMARCSAMPTSSLSSLSGRRSA